MTTTIDALTTDRPVLSMRDVRRKGRAAQEAFELYQRTNSLPLLPWPESTPAELAGYLDIIYGGIDQDPFGGREPAGQPAEPWQTLRRNPRMWVAYTGGKDSVAAALRAQEQDWQPVLYHLAGLNRGMGDEPRYAARTADKMGWPLLIERVHVAGAKAGLMELPTKNQVTALFLTNRMAADADAIGGADYCTGWHLSDSQDKQDFGYDYSDGVEAIAAFNEYLYARYPGLRYTQMLHDTTEAWAIIAAHGLLQYIKGCVCPLRYKANLRRRNVEKFGWLLTGRCGSCVKCAWEEYALQAIGVLPHRPDRLAHGQRWMTRDFGVRFPGLTGKALDAAVNEFLVPQDGVDAHRRAAWPDQPAPFDEAEGTPEFWTIDDRPYGPDALAHMS